MIRSYAALLDDPDGICTELKLMCSKRDDVWITRIDAGSRLRDIPFKGAEPKDTGEL